MRNRQAPFGHYFRQVAIAERIAKVPTNAQQDDFGFVMPPSDDTAADCGTLPETGSGNCSGLILIIFQLRLDRSNDIFQAVESLMHPHWANTF